jgi:hypothetical protein
MGHSVLRAWHCARGTMGTRRFPVVRRPIENCPGEELIIVTAAGYRAGPAA